MRQIDADAFDERVRVAVGMSEEELSEDFKDGILAVLYMMSKQPTITAQPERPKGEWITDDLSGIISCSRCGNAAPMETTGGRQYKSKFCQTCGADMKYMADDAQYFVDVEEALNMATNVLTAQPETHDKRTEMHACDLIDRQALMKEFSDFVRASNNSDFARTPTWNDAVSLVGSMPSAQPERTCVNCGRTANNGGWYADGRTRCPIEEHYALPKDGYCHLWEKRNVTDDDYPERRTDGRD